MSRGHKITYITAGIIIIAVVLGGLWWHGRGGDTDKPVTTGRQTVGDHTISLGQEPSEDAGGLSVSSGTASNLGQLEGQSRDLSGSGSSSTGASDFARYDKYKNNKSALFGDINQGTGTKLTEGRKASVLYKGWLTDGTVVDQSPTNSSGTPRPFTFTMGAHEVIPGWEQAMYGMRAGGTRLLIVPPAVGYGSEGKGVVPPDAVLVFEVRLTSVR